MRKRKLGILAKAFEHPDMLIVTTMAKMKSDESTKAAIPPFVLLLITKLGPILLKLLLDKLGIKV